MSWPHQSPGCGNCRPRAGWQCPSYKGIQSETSATHSYVPAISARTLKQAWMVAGLEGWMDGWVDGWMDGWTLAMHPLVAPPARRPPALVPRSGAPANTSPLSRPLQPLPLPSIDPPPLPKQTHLLVNKPSRTGLCRDSNITIRCTRRGRRAVAEAHVAHCF